MKKTDSILYNIKLPSDLKKLNYRQCAKLCAEIRKLLIKTVGKNGGHLSSNLGTVELTVALHRNFDSPKDKIVWDVGHQAYTHKILTGRLGKFGSLRKENGISGFTRPSESKHDAFISGHSSISVSAACGIGMAMQLDNDDHHVIAVVGDGAFTGGEIYEGLNNAGKGLNNLIVILNDNEMSISKNVGAVARYLTSIRGSENYISVKKQVEKALVGMPEIIGRPIIDIIIRSKDTLRWILYHDTMFENLGFVYLGPVDGHNMRALDEVLKAAKLIGHPVLVHVTTVKGKGFPRAEKNPGAFHGVSPMEIKYGNPEIISEDCYSAVFGRELLRLAEKDKNICAVTAAMKYATGLQYIASEIPERFFDVGIAEEHAVTFCGGLASAGKIPVFAVYSSFLQRAFDQLIHDNSIPLNHIVLGVDRAGIVGGDGETHQGIYDVSMLSSIPNTVIFSPSDYGELMNCLERALYHTKGIAAVRYPKGRGKNEKRKEYKDFLFEEKGSDILAVTYGRISDALFDRDIICDKLRLIKIFPIESGIIKLCGKYKKIIFFEEGIRSGGIGEHLLSEISENGFSGTFRIRAINGNVPQSDIGSALHKLGLDKAGMKKAVEDLSHET